jgi:N-acetylglucosaminyldiphosphoundecaprenol N-acetyl-beta-D-mannosaminyltransferase
MLAQDVHENRARVCFMGICVDNLMMDEAIECVITRLNYGSPAFVAFVNANCVNIAYECAEYRRVLYTADYVFADGIGMRLAGRLLGQSLRDNVNGTDLFPLLCSRLEKTRFRLFLYGGKPGVAEKVREWIEAQYRGVIVCGSCHGYLSSEQSSDVARMIRESQPDLLLVALGTPAQELWIAQNMRDINVRVAIGVGGLFDFFGGRVRRAPLWLRKINMEWAYRLMREPKRLWRRYLIGNPVFLWRVFRARFSA